MPFQRPNLPELIEQKETDIEARLPGADARMRRSNLNVLARVQAAGDHGLYGFIEWISKQMLPDTAEAEFLDRHAKVWGITRTAASFASGNVTFAGTNGTTIPAGTKLKRSNDTIYTMPNEALIGSATVTTAVFADAAGADSNGDAAGAINLLSPIAGLTSQATIAAGGLTGGADTEMDEAHRERVMARIQQPAHGGAGFDYVTWALEQPGVTRAWVYPQELGLGTVTVRFMMDDIYSDGIPLASDVNALQAAIDLVRPVTADVTVVAPVADPLNIATLSITPSNSIIQAAIEAEVADLILRSSEPGGTSLISHLREAISIAAGETDHALTDPSADITRSIGQIAVVGTYPWSA